MQKLRKNHALGLMLVAALSLDSTRAGAEGSKPLSPEAVPAPLKPWVSWVLHDVQGVACPRLQADDETQPVCGWPGQLQLQLDASAGRFIQTYEVYEQGSFALPGGTDDEAGARWPLDVSVDGKRAAVVDRDGVPFVVLAAGKHTVTGRFAWDALPESLAVPQQVALVSVTVQGKALTAPQRTGDGRVFFAKAVAEDDSDSVDITVHRKLQDGVPVLLTTRVTLAVSGKSRELVLGRALPEGFVPLSLSSGLPVRIEPDGRLRTQVRPGQWTIELVARNVAQVESVVRPAPEGPWKEGEEAWVFAAAPAVRSVTIEGVPAIDPQQTTLPDEWKALPTYAVEPGATLKLVQHQRGNEPPLPDRLSLSRQLWLDFDGAAFTVRDNINGTLSRSWRLSMQPPAQLGRLSVNGEDQFITTLGDNKQSGGLWGAEIRVQNARIEADSRVPRTGMTIPAVAWHQDFDSLSGQVHLGPGWKLLFGAGADHVNGSWVQAWSLLDLFLLLIVAVSVQRLYGYRVGAVAFAALLLSLNEGDAPAWVWLAVVIAEALLRLVPPGKLAWVPRVLRLGSWAVWLFIFVPFAAQDLRLALHPAATRSGGWSIPMPGAAPAPAAVQQYAKMQADAPAAEPEEIEESVEGRVVESVGAGAPAANSLHGLYGRKRDSFSKRNAQMTQNLAVWDKSVVVQTGPGIPSWQWDTISFSYNGPVQADQSLSLWLLPPWLTSFLAILRVVLLAALAFLMFKRHRLSLASVAIAMPFILLALVPSRALADEPAPVAPPADVLETLKQRLLRPPTCSPHCATVDELQVDASAQLLKLRFTVSALARAAVALPGQPDGWLPSQVRVNNQAAVALSRDDKGVLWAVVNEGANVIEMQGAFPAKESLSLTLPVIPKFTRARLQGVQLEGLRTDGQASETLQFTRVVASAQSKGKDAAGADGVVPLLLVRREITLGLRWTTHTTVERLGESIAPVLADIPLLPGESVTSAGVVLATNGRAVALNLSPGTASATWDATLSHQLALTLKAPSADRVFVEEWQVAAAPMWHVDVQGIPTLRGEGNTDAQRMWLWRPWPNESVSLAITRPSGVEGQTLTIDNSSATYSPGPRSTQVNLQWQSRTSRGREHVITLPAGAVVSALSINGTSTPVRSSSTPHATQVTLTLVPGANSLVMDWRYPAGHAFAFKPAAVNLGVKSTNASTVVQLRSAGRWVLWTAGPLLGPAVFFWSYLLVLVALGYVLARTKLSPLSMLDWALLGLGLVQVGLPAVAFVSGFFLLLGWRLRIRRPARAWAYNFTQLTFVLWTGIAAVLVFAAIRAGLLESPDMQVMGNGSDETLLRWYSDQALATLPQPLVISVPLFVYRIAMMAWALWLALALLRWSRWVWAAFLSQGLWKPMRKAKVVPKVEDGS